MNPDVSPEKEDENNKTLSLIVKVAGITTLVIVLILMSVFIYFTSKSPLNVNEIGQVGDYFGGLINPLLSFFTIVLLIWALQIQIKELALTRAELKLSADSQKELVNQGRHSFFIQQAVEALESTEVKVQSILTMKYELEYTKYSAHNDSFTIRFVADDNSELSELASLDVNLDNWPREKILSGITAYKPEDDRKLFLLVTYTEYMMINLTCLIERHAWSQSLIYAHMIGRNLTVIRNLDSHQGTEEKKILKLYIFLELTAEKERDKLKGTIRQMSTIDLISSLLLEVKSWQIRDKGTPIVF